MHFAIQFKFRLLGNNNVSSTRKTSITRPRMFMQIQSFMNAAEKTGARISSCLSHLIEYYLLAWYKHSARATHFSFQLLATQNSSGVTLLFLCVFASINFFH